MSTPKQYNQLEIRGLILQEFQANHSAQQAKRNICQQAGPKAVAAATVSKWYRKFESGDLSIRNANAKNKDEPVTFSSDFYLRANKSILFESDDERFVHGFKSIDGRIGFSHHHDLMLSVVDLFHAKFRDVWPSEGSAYLKQFHTFEVLDNEHLLFCSNTSFLLIYIDYEHMKYKSLDKLERDNRFMDYIVADTNNPSHFVFSSGNSLQFGKINEGKICIEDQRYPTKYMRHLKFVNGTVGGFSVVQDGDGRAVKYHEFSAKGEQLRCLDIPMLLDDKPLNHDLFYYGASAWSGNRFYSSNKTYNDRTRDHFVYVLDVSEQEWSKLDITFTSNIKSMCIGIDECLTVCSGAPPKRVTVTKRPCFAVHRILLKQPDTLRNNVWSTLRYHRNFNNSEMFAKIVDRLPYTSNLRVKLPNDVI